MKDITENFDQFVSALRMLVPLFDRAGIIWSNDGQYDEFYEVSDSLFHAFIISTFSDNTRYSSFYQSYRYYSDGNPFQFAVIDANTNESLGAFVRFVTKQAPFDSLELSSPDGARFVKFYPSKTKVMVE